MPHLLSICGIRMTRRYVRNWFSLIAVYSGIIPHATAVFRDGTKIPVTRAKYHDFREKLFQCYLSDEGFSYVESNHRKMIHTNSGIKMYLLPYYSNAIDEIFLRKVYGDKRLEGRSVIDVGASIGDSSLYFATLGSSCIYALESDPSIFQIALENIRMNNMLNAIHLYNVSVTSHYLASLILEKKMSNIFLKLDCEGCEYEIISRLSSKIYEQIDDIVMEYHESHIPIVKRLSEVGYKLKKSKPMLAPGGLIYASRT
jgi:hypothetical protein